MASSDLQQTLTTLQLSNYVNFMTTVGVGYDYLLTFSKEIEYIWNKPWTWVSTLFVLARYFGMCNVVTNFLFGSPFVPGPAGTYVFMFSSDYTGRTIWLAGSWCFWVFLCSSELMIILRVWAMNNRSIFVLYTLLALYSVEIILFLISDVLLSTNSPLNPIVVNTTQVLDSSFCVLQDISHSFGSDVGYIVQIIFGALMCLFTALQFIKTVVRVYRATKQFRLNRYMKLLVREGMLYFVVVLSLAIINMVFNAGTPALGWQMGLAWGIQGTLMFTLIPRFVLSLRELYARGLLGSGGSEIDTAYGLGSRDSAAVNTIVFADAEQSDNSEWGEEIQMEERVPEIHQASRNG